MIDSIRVAYAALRTRGAPQKDDLAVVEVPATAGVYAGFDHLGREHVLIPLGTGASPGIEDAEIATLSFGTRTLDVADGRGVFLDVACLFDSVAEVFEHFVAAILESLAKDPDEPGRAITRVIDRWRQFLEPPESPPGRSALASVLGELLVLRDVVQATKSRKIDSWVGPFGGRHDFRRGETALEVKTTRSHTSRKITVHGEDQLVEPEGGRLYLHLVRFEEVAGSGLSVAAVVDALLSLGVHPESLFTALSASGLALTELAATADVRFDIRERLTLPVDEEMPRIVPSSFVGGARPVGVIDVDYVIDLDHRLDAALDDGAYLELLGALSGGDE